jgi:asparagine synthase (glutamine-hydrolysing)
MKTRFRRYFRSPFPRAFEGLLIEQARAFDDDAMIADEVNSVIERFASEAIRCNVNSVLDMKMFYNIFCSTIGSNYILSDISGLAAQVEVRSPYLDYRIVEFAARLPHQYKIGNIFTSNLNKYLPKLCYEKYVPKYLAWSNKKGLSYNIRFSDYIKKCNEPEKLFSASCDAIDRAGLNSRNSRTVCSKYIASISKGIKPTSADFKTMMNAFMLGRWLMLNKNLAV